MKTLRDVDVEAGLEVPRRDATNHQQIEDAVLSVKPKHGKLDGVCSF